MLLAPFKWIVALFFNWSNALFNDPGWAVVGMSVLLSLLLTPLYVWIERRKNSDKAKGAPMQAEIDKIEAVYTGRERFYYTREIQRRYKYSPWTAMIPTLGLLVQIPFLLAAYHYLSELPIFNGASFWYIKDLSKPDTIATVAGLPINLLAILMTAINLISGWRYAESGKPKERIQYMAVAAIFLFLLYNCAASVVLYWTLSNALSLARSEIFFIRKTPKTAQRPMWSKTYLVLIRSVCEYLLILAVVLAADAVLLSGRPYVSWFMTSRQLYAQSGFIIYLVFALLFAMSIVRSTHGVSMPYAFNLFAAIALFAILIPIAGLYLGCPVGSSQLLLWLSKISGPVGALFAVVAIGIGWKFFFANDVVDMQETTPRHKDIGILLGALLSACISLQVLFCGPICAYASFPEGAPEVAATSLFWSGFFSVIIFVGVICLMLRLLPLRAGLVLQYVLVLVSLIMFVHGNILPSDYGVLFHGSYGNSSNIVPREGQLLLEAIVISAAPFITRAVIRLILKNRSLSAILLLVISATYILRASVALIRMPLLPKDEVVSAESDGKLFRFSTGAQNVVFLLLDNVLGQRFGHILDSDARLREDFEGFVWYPNTISASTFTFPDLPAIWGGEEYFPSRIGKTRKLGEVFVSAWDSYKSRILANGYRFSCSKMVQSFGCSLDGVERSFSEMDYKSNHIKKGAHSINLIALIGNAFLRAMPYVLRPHIYDDGRWNFSEVENPLTGAFDFLVDLVPNSEVTSDPKGAYIHIHSEATHFPFYTSVNGKLKCLGVDRCYKWSLEKAAEWMRWMKTNGVYDNTRIILCSDHGIGDSVGMSLDSRYVKNVDTMKSAAGGACPFFALLAVKDFQARGEIKVDVSTKTVSHGTYFALCESRFDTKVEEVVPSTVVNPYPPDWKRLDGFQILNSFRILGDASDGKNWEKK